MKFAREFDTSLQKGEFPQAWLDSAISYRKLKKCIRKVQEELQELGLDRKTLETVWQQGHASISDGVEDLADSRMRYVVQDRNSKATQVVFTPKLTIALDPEDGSPLDAWLSPETRRHLRRIMRRRQSSRRPSTISIDSESDRVEELDGSADGEDQIETVEVPLLADTEFFAILQRELTQLDHLQETEQEHLNSEIVCLGHELDELKHSRSKKAKASINDWREIFRLYIESQIFFSSHEQDAGLRDSKHAQTQLERFNRDLTAFMSKRKSSLDPAAQAALDRFLDINLELLRFIKFQEINLTALSKILKKFDKQTALKSSLIKTQWLNTAPLMANAVAKNTCYAISQNLLLLIPQLEDYLCPICFSVAYKPIRLSCNHLFCIRCLVVMQREEQKHCPLCRGEVIMEADTDNIDMDMVRFLKKHFPQEVKEKQQANELAAGVDLFGDGYKGTHRCIVM